MCCGVCKRDVLIKGISYNCLVLLWHDGRYAFVMSLSSHFSTQIQNNCVIMNVDTNQHRAHLKCWFVLSHLFACSASLSPAPHSFSNSLVCKIFHALILRHEFMHALCGTSYIWICVCLCVFCINNWISVSFILRCWIRFYLFTWLNKFIIIEVIVCLWCTFSTQTHNKGRDWTIICLI